MADLASQPSEATEAIAQGSGIASRNATAMQLLQVEPTTAAVIPQPVPVAVQTVEKSDDVVMEPVSIPTGTPDVSMEPVGTPVALEPHAPMAAEGGMEQSASQPEISATGADSAADTVVDDEDPVVQECDVYLNRMYDPPDFVGDMYVLQFPLRPAYRPYGDQGELEKVEIKPKSRRLRYVHRLKQGDNYDDGGVVGTERLGQRHVLSSTVVTNPNISYAVGVIHQGRMTLTPIRAVNQLRPDFETFERMRAQQHRAGNTATGEEADGAAQADAAGLSDSGPDEPRDLVARPPDQIVGASAVKVDYVAQSKTGQQEVTEPEESWTRLDFYNAHTEEAKDIYEKHIVWPAAAAAEAEDAGVEPDHPKMQKLVFNSDAESYIACMCGQAVPGKARKEQSRSEEKNPDDGLSSYVLSRMPAERQVEAVVRHFSVVSYSRQLRKRLPPNTLRALSDTMLMEMLQQCAVLAAGNWVLKSQHAGFEGLEAHARDLLICLLDKRCGALRREEYEKWAAIFEKCTQRAARDEMTRSIAVWEEESKTWKLKNPPDNEFVKQFPKVAEESGKWWDVHRVDIIKKVQSIDRRSSGHAGAAAVAAASARQRGRWLNEVREVLALGAMSTVDLRKTIQKRNPTVAVRQEELEQVLVHKDLEAVQVRDLWMLARTGKQDHDKFRTTLASLFRQRDLVSRKDILTEYEQQHKEECKLSDYVMRTLLREITDRADRDSYVLKGTLMRD